MALRTLALCAGIGGLERGVALAADVRLVGAVERQAFAAAALVARMEDSSLAPAPIWDDVSTFDGRRWRGRVDLICGGFPCQDASVAGKGAGIYGSRTSLWFRMLDIIEAVRPIGCPSRWATCSTRTGWSC